MTSSEKCDRLGVEGDNMRGKRIKQINNLVITLGIDNEYMVWRPSKYFVYRKNDADNKINACRRNNRNGLYLGDFI